MSATYTEGPWRVVNPGVYARSDRGEIHVDADTRGFICSAGIRGDAEAEANAHLIAAAPDLLAALKALKEQLESMSDIYHGLGDADDYKAIDMAKDAIAKAEGRDE